MKQISSITGINLIVLLIAVLVVNSLSVTPEIIYFLPLMVLVAVNIVLGSIYFYKRQPGKAKSFILSCLLLLIIGGSSCVAIKIKAKKAPKQAAVEKTNAG